ncbi:MAG: Gfo/Idh/MocA family oxidoreductase [Synechococcaceae cyanobacterium]|nr:Gfo/Idh/MocA family oxidoreductase [Synechococcaceae cyanobacterium]
MKDHTDTTSATPQPSRRAFLAHTAAFGAGTFLASCAAPGRFPRKPSVEKAPRVPLGEGEPIRMGVIGTGGMGGGHCHAIINLNQAGEESVQIVALCDVCDPRLEGARKVCAEKQGINVDTYRDFRELLARDDLHGVLIATPEHWHGTMSRDALWAGKDVYVEKPMTLRLDDALYLREVVLDHPEMIFQVGTQKMILPKYLAAKELIAEGAIGKPTFSQTSYCRNSIEGEWLYYAIDPAWEPGVNLDWDAWCGPLGAAPWDPQVYARWRRYRRYSTGIIGDLLVHQMTPLMLALDMGWPVRVVASGGHYVDKAMENHDQININVEFEKEHTMLIAGSTCNETGLETLIRGHHANLYLGGRHCELRPERNFADEIEPLRVDCPDIGNDQDQLRLDWLRCIRSREPAVSGIDLATKMMVAVDLATRSVWEGHAYEFDPDTMKASAI